MMNGSYFAALIVWCSPPAKTGRDFPARTRG